MSVSTWPESTGGPAGRLGCRRAPVLCPAPAGVGRTLDGLSDTREHPASVSDQCWPQKVLGWRMAGPHLSWPFGVAATKHHQPGGLWTGRLFLRVWRLETFASQGLEAGVGAPGAAGPGSGEGLTLGLPTVRSHARWRLSRNKGTNCGHEGLILMPSSPHAPPPRTGPSPWGRRFHPSPPFISRMRPLCSGEDSSIKLVIPDLRFGAPHCCQGHLRAEEDRTQIQKERAIRLAVFLLPLKVLWGEVCGETLADSPRPTL